MRTTRKKKVEKPVKMIPVKSSNIESHGYKKPDMYIKYLKGDTYIFKDVSKELYESIVNAESIGKAMFASKLKGIKL